MTEYIKCETCLYNKNCQFLAGHKNTIVEDCSAYKNAADVIEVQHGYWYNINHYQDYAFATCSVCKESGTLRVKRDSWGIWYIHSPHCPNCGAKMDGGK